MAPGHVDRAFRRLRQLGVASDTASDAALLERFVTRREQSAFAALVGRYAPLVWGVCRRVLHHEQDAEDAFQATFLILARKAAALDGRTSLTGWLYTVAAHVARRARADADRRRRHERQASAAPLAVADPAAAAQELRPLLDEELRQLPEKYRLPLVLCYLQGRTHEQAAAELGWPTGSMSRRLTRARELLRQRLIRRGITAPAALLATVLADEAAAAVPARIVTAPASERAAAWTAAASRSLAGTTRTATLVLLLTAGVLGLGASAFLPAPLVDPPAFASLPESRPAPGGDGLPPGAVARLGTLRLVQGSQLTGLAFAPDGKALASSGWDGTVRLWDIPTGQELRQWPLSPAKNEDASRQRVRCVAFAPDGKTLATGGPGPSLRLLDRATGRELRRWKAVEENRARRRPLADAIHSLSFAPDGKLIASTGSDGRVRLWDAATGKEARRLPSSKSAFYALAFAPDGKLLAGGGDGFVRLWDVADGKTIRQLTAGPKENTFVFCLAFSPDGKRLSAGGRGMPIRTWDVASGQQGRHWGDPRADVRGLAFVRGGKVLAARGPAQMMRLWDVRTGKELHAWECGDQYAPCLTASPNGKLLASSGPDSTIRLWRADTGREVSPPVGHRARVVSVAVAPDSRLLASASFDRTVRLWDAKTGRELRRFDHERQVSSVAFSPNGQLLASGDWGQTILLRNASTGRVIQRLEAPAYGSVIAFDPGGRTLLSAANDNIVRVWDVTTGRELRHFGGPAPYMHALACSPDGKTVAAAGSDGTVRLWEVATGNERRHWLVRERGAVHTVAFSSDGKLLASGDNAGEAALWNAATGEKIHALGTEPPRPAGASTVHTVVFSPSGRLLASVGTDGIRLWEVLTGKKVLERRGHRGEVLTAAFFPDGRRLATGSDDTTILLWELGARGGRQGK